MISAAYKTPEEEAFRSIMYSRKRRSVSNSAEMRNQNAVESSSSNWERSRGWKRRQLFLICIIFSKRFCGVSGLPESPSEDRRSMSNPKDYDPILLF